MRTLPISELAEIVSGATPKTSNPDFWGGGVFWATPADLSKLDGPYIASTPRTLTEAGLRSCAAEVLPPGSVLLSSRAPIGHVAINKAPMATNQGFKSLIPRPELMDPKYLYHWLRANTDYLQSLGNGATFKELSKSTVSRVEVPSPSLDEQRRIAAILDQADALRTKCRQAVTKLDDLVQSKYLHMFGNPMTKNLYRRSLGEVGKVITGNTPSRANPLNYGDGIEWIKSDNLGGLIATSAEERLTATGQQTARVVPEGSVLVTCIAGTPASIGRASLVDREVAFNQQINAVVPGPAIDGRFLLEQLRVAPNLVRQQSTGGMKGLVSKSKFEAIQVEVPPLDSQRQFVEIACQTDNIRAQQTVAVAEADSLFWSLQARAFSGQL